jgi:hypothetical protein
MLYEAAIYAADVDRSRWDFGLELDFLTDAGLSPSDLRWLMCNGYVEHAKEVKSNDSRSRKFDSNSHSFTRTSCFVLTDAGHSLVHQLLSGNVEEACPDPTTMLSSSESMHTAMKPFWDRDRQELRVGSQIVKRFVVPAPSQEIILAAFQEDDWPECIHDPLPQREPAEAPDKLQDAIHSLNQNQRSELIRFFADDEKGICWEFVRGLKSPNN